jgi:hypothetical protein
MKVGKVTTAQKNNIVGQSYAPDCYFNPIQDNNNNWVISLEEMNGRVLNPDFFWVRDLPQIEFEPKPSNLII